MTRAGNWHTSQFNDKLRSNRFPKIFPSFTLTFLNFHSFKCLTFEDPIPIPRLFQFSMTVTNPAYNFLYQRKSCIKYIFLKRKNIRICKDFYMDCHSFWRSDSKRWPRRLFCLVIHDIIIEFGPILHKVRNLFVFIISNNRVGIRSLTCTDRADVHSGVGCLSDSLVCTYHTTTVWRWKGTHAEKEIRNLYWLTTLFSIRD